MLCGPGKRKPNSDLIPYSILSFLKMSKKTHTKYVRCTGVRAFVCTFCVCCFVRSFVLLLLYSCGVLLIFSNYFIEKHKKHALRDEGPSNGQQSMLSHIIVYFVVFNFIYAKLCFPIALWHFVKSSPNNKTKKTQTHTRLAFSLKYILYIIFLLAQ